MVVTRSHTAAVAGTPVTALTLSTPKPRSSSSRRLPPPPVQDDETEEDVPQVLGPIEEDLPPRTKRHVEERMKIFQQYLQKNRMTHHVHQEEGVRWCLQHEMHPDPPFGVRGGFLADDMGLGKTIIMLGVILAYPRRRTLIVLPPILVQQWANLIEHTVTKPQLLIYVADTRHRVENGLLVAARMVITTYTMLHDVRLQALPWDRVIFDEAHYLRNFHTQRHQQAKSLQTPIRWLVSGTPINNCLADYYNLAALLGLPATAYIDMPMILRRYVLRRTKQSVGLRLPPLTFHDIPVRCASKKEQFLHDFVQSRLSFCNMQADTKHYDPKAHPISSKAENASPIQLLGQARHMSAYMQCTASKLTLVLGTLLSNRRLYSGTKHLVFCTYHDEIDFVQQSLADQDVPCTVVDGRHAMPKEDLKDVLILQIDSCCEGLNLQQYSHLYFVMPHWNPAVEMQAIARAHRIGQLQTVHVHRFYFAAEERERMVTQVTATALEGFLKLGPGSVCDDEPLSMDQYVRMVQRKKCVLQLMDGRAPLDQPTAKRSRKK